MPDKETQDDLIHVGYTNGYQIKYAKGDTEDSVGQFYGTTDGNSLIPLYMLKSHAERIETTSQGNITLEMITNLTRLNHE